MPKKSYNLYFPHSLLGYQNSNVLPIYGVLQVLYQGVKCDDVVFTLDSVQYCLTGSLPSYDVKNNLKNIINNIDGIEELKSGIYKLDTTSFNLDEPFIICSSKAFEVLKNNAGALKHYLYIIKQRSYNIEVMGRKSVICSLPTSYFAKIENVNEKTIQRYNKQLEDLKLIYIRKSDYHDGVRDANIYSLYEDRDYANSFAGGVSSHDKSNFRRKVSGQYNRFIKNPDCYSHDQIVKLYNDVKQYNEEMAELGKSQPDYLKRIKALDIFDRYLT